MATRHPATESGSGAAAAILAAGVGVLVLGIVIVLAEASPTLKQLSNWYPQVGPLGGKTTVAAIAYFVAWSILHARLRHRTVDSARLLTVTVGMVLAALVLTFPPFYLLFSHVLP